MITSAQPQPAIAPVAASAGETLARERAKPRLLIFALAACLMVLLSGCAATGDLANPPRVTLADLRLAQVGLMEQRYAAKLRVQNPNDAELSVRGMEYTIYINGRKFADGVSGRHFRVPRYSEAIVEVDLTSTVLRVFEQLQSLSSGESQTFRYSIAGSLSLEGFRRSVAFSHEDVIDLSPKGGG